MSVSGMSHRGKEFISIAAQAEADLRELLAIPAGYKVLFLQGGASQQFAMVPMNLLRGKTTADYVNTGAWSEKAIGEGKRLCEARVVATSEATKFSTIPPVSEWKLNPAAAYLHYTPNETIGGVEFHFVPDAGRAARRRHVLDAALPPDRRQPLRPDLCRRAEEHRSGSASPS